MKTIPWTENFKFPSSKYDIQEIDVKSFNAWVYEQLPWLKHFPVFKKKGGEFAACINIDENHKFLVKQFSEEEVYNPYAELCGFVPEQLLPDHSRKRQRQFEIINSSRTKSAVTFNGKPIVPILFKDMQFSGWQPIMSLTPMEAMTMRPLIRKAKGKVLIGGLGMGYLTRRVLQRKQVKSVLVIEKNPDIIEFFGKYLFEEFGDRVKIIKGDMYGHSWQNHDTALWDIWDEIGDAGWDRKYRAIRETMKEAGKACVGWTDWEPQRS